MIMNNTDFFLNKTKDRIVDCPIPGYGQQKYQRLEQALN